MPERASTPRTRKPPEMPMLPEPVESEAFLLGRISGQLRELIHLVNNISSKQDALALRVAALEAAENRRDGATGVLSLILKSPAIGWLFGAVITAWAILTGKVHV